MTTSAPITERRYVAPLIFVTTLFFLWALGVNLNDILIPHLKKVFDLNYPNHRMADVSQNELQCRLIFLIRLLKVDTVVCWDPWAHDEENPDHYVLARAIEAAAWMAGREHDFPEQLACGLELHTVTEKYYYARRPEITRVVNANPIQR